LSYTITGLPTAGTLYQTTFSGARASPITSVPAAVASGAHQLIFAPAADANGAAYSGFSFTVNDGTSDSPAATVAIAITPVNDAPSFTPGANQSVGSSAGAQTVAGWVSSFTAGPANEAGQTVLSYTIMSNTNLGLFAVAPAIAADGTLTYTPKAGASGQATIGIVVRDSGGTANGGQDTSPAQTFTVTVTPGYRVALPLVLR
jgi:hypothetical protein